MNGLHSGTWAYLLSNTMVTSIQLCITVSGLYAGGGGGGGGVDTRGCSPFQIDIIMIM